MNIGNKIKELRKSCGITQEQLANSIGVSFQAVSKWENNIALPDITLAPVLASYFGVSIDELFGYNTEKIREKVLSIARRTVKFRESNQSEGIKIIEEGLKEYPNNDILLENLLYLIDYCNDPDKTIEIASKIIDITKDNSIKYDALRFLAYAYKYKGDLESARKSLEQIPEIYFSRLSEMAYILSGEEKMNAAQKQKGISLSTLIEMQTRIAECHIDNKDMRSALKEYEIALNLLELFEASNAWDVERNFLNNRIIYVKKQI